MDQRIKPLNKPLQSVQQALQLGEVGRVRLRPTECFPNPLGKIAHHGMYAMLQFLGRLRRHPRRRSVNVAVDPVPQIVEGFTRSGADNGSIVGE